MTDAGPGRYVTIHGSACVLGESGVLVRGPSGAGKSALVHRLIEAGRDRGLFARLVADDRVRLAASNGRLVARPVPPLAGLVELRGVGLARVDFEPAAVVRLLVDIDPGQRERLPAPRDLSTDVLEICLPRMVIAGSENFAVVIWRLCGGDDTLMTVP